MPRKAKADNQTAFVNLQGIKAEVLTAAEAAGGMNLSTYIRQAIQEKIRRDAPKGGAR